MPSLRSQNQSIAASWSFKLVLKLPLASPPYQPVGPASAAPALQGNGLPFKLKPASREARKQSGDSPANTTHVIPRA